MHWNPNRNEAYSNDGAKNHEDVEEMNAHGICGNNEVLSASKLNKSVFLLQPAEESTKG